MKREQRWMRWTEAGQNHVQRGISEADSRWLFQQLIIAVDYCHRLGIANRDIKVRRAPDCYATDSVFTLPEMTNARCGTRRAISRGRRLGGCLAHLEPCLQKPVAEP